MLNGAIEKIEHVNYLREVGYKLKRCAGIPERKPTEEEIEEMVAADKVLGRHRNQSGTTPIERDLAKGIRGVLAPLRRALRRSLFARHS